MLTLANVGNAIGLAAGWGLLALPFWAWVL